MSSLNKPVMVLNKSWMAIRVVPTHKAFTYLFAEKASAIDVKDWNVYGWDQWVRKGLSKDAYGVIHTSSEDVEIPEIIVLSTYNKIFRKKIGATKKNIYIRDGYTCQYTGKKIKKSEADIDHIIPKSRGGKDTWGNMVVCTKKINRKKRNKTPQEAGLKLIRKPREFIDQRMTIEGFPINYKGKTPFSWSKFVKGIV